MSDEHGHDHGEREQDHGGENQDGHNDGDLGHDGHNDGDQGHDGHGHGDRDHSGHDHSHGEHDHNHDHHHHDVDSVSVAVVTISTSRTLDEDPSGDSITAAFEDHGHTISTRELVPDDFDTVQGTVDRLVSREDTEAVLTAGGTGVTPDDVTPEAVLPLFEKQLPGFGELFRAKSVDEIGTRTIGSRAIGGIADGVLVFCLPGSKNAVELGVDEIILPEIGHLVGLAKRHEDEEADETEE